MFPAFDSGEFHPTYVDSVVDAIIAIVEEPPPAGTIFSIGGERPILLRALRALIAEVLLFALMGWPMPLLAEASRGVCVSSAVDDRPFRKRYPAVPITLLIDERSDGVHLGYDKVESLLAPYGSVNALAVARSLDEKIEKLMRDAAG